MNNPKTEHQKRPDRERPEIQRLLPRHYRILDLVLSGQYTVKAIAQQMDMSPQAVSLIINSPVFQHQLARRRREIEKQRDESLSIALAEAQEELKRAAPQAARVHAELLEDEDPRVRQSSANAILDRVGLGKQQIQQGQVSITVLDENALRLLGEALKESRGDAKVLEDVKVIEKEPPDAES